MKPRRAPSRADIRAAAVHRSEAAFDWLLSIVAVDALSVYERNTKLAERINAALAKRGRCAGARSDPG